MLYGRRRIDICSEFVISCFAGISVLHPRHRRGAGILTIFQLTPWVGPSTHIEGETIQRVACHRMKEAWSGSTAAILFFTLAGQSGGGIPSGG